MNAHAKTKRPAASKFFNPFPKYLQLRELLRKRMQSQYEVGDRLPTEDALSKEFGVSRETVREALRSFEYDGLIERHRARGTFLLRKPEELQESRLTGLSEDFSALRLDTHTKMLASGVITAPAIAKQLKLDSDSVFRISRLRYFEGKPLAVHVAHLPLFIGERVNSADLRLTSIVQVMEDVLHIECYELSQQVDAIVADPEFAGQLEVPIGSPILVLGRLFKMNGALQLLLFQSYYRADRYHYTVEVADAKREKGTKAVKAIPDRRFGSGPVKR